MLAFEIRADRRGVGDRAKDALGADASIAQPRNAFRGVDLGEQHLHLAHEGRALHAVDHEIRALGHRLAPLDRICFCGT
jgi:hypothetical protein